MNTQTESHKVEGHGPENARTGERLAGPLSTQLKRSVGVLRDVLGAGVVDVMPVRDGQLESSLARSVRPDVLDDVVERLRGDVVDLWPADGEEHEIQAQVDWSLTLVPVLDGENIVTGLVMVGRTTPVRFTEMELMAVRALAVLCGLAFTRATNERQALHQRSLDELVTNVAVKLMSVSRESLRAALADTLRTLAEFFEVDTVFLRSNDLERGVTILIDEWPRRENVPDPDPLGVVPFDADPIFAATRDLSEPLTMRPSGSDESYQDRVNQGSGVPQVSFAMVPLLNAEVTTGVIGFVKFGDRPWVTPEINALRAIASLLVQLQARIDAEERLQYSAFYDQLTGLANRRALLEELSRRLAPTAEGRTALLFMDLDRFKTMNDFLGHQAGDRLLVVIADRIRTALRPRDFAARLGGDEFVIILAGDAETLEASAVADRMLELVAMPIELDGHQIIRTGSIGIAFANAGEMTAEGLLGHADAALYTAKEQGRNRAVIFDDELRAARDERSDTEMLLREVIDQGGLQLYYHPEIDLRSGALLACEALVRWHHPVRGFLPAGAFIKVAEETGLVVDLGKWVLNEACRQMAEWLRRYPSTDMSVRVNMSPAQLVSRNIIDVVARALAQHGLPGNRLCIEITEHAVMQDVDRAIGILREFRALGVGLAIDDFGTGFSSMAQLKRLPVDTLKVDRSFVTGLGTDPGDRAIVESIVRLAEAFSLDLVAEGVETVTHIEQLLELGCYRSQGFLLSLPLPATVMDTVIRRGGIEIPGSITHAA